MRPFSGIIGLTSMGAACSLGFVPPLPGLGFPWALHSHGSRRGLAICRPHGAVREQPLSVKTMAGSILRHAQSKIRSSSMPAFPGHGRGRNGRCRPGPPGFHRPYRAGLRDNRRARSAGAQNRVRRRAGKVGAIPSLALRAGIRRLGIAVWGLTGGFHRGGRRERGEDDWTSD